MSEYDFTPMVHEIAARIQYRIDQAALDKVEGTLAEFGYVKVVQCRDCEYFDPNDESSKVYPNRYWCNLLANYLQPDGFCAWGVRKKGGENDD